MLHTHGDFSGSLRSLAQEKSHSLKVLDKLLGKPTEAEQTTFTNPSVINKKRKQAPEGESFEAGPKKSKSSGKGGGHGGHGGGKGRGGRGGKSGFSRGGKAPGARGGKSRS